MDPAVGTCLGSYGGFEGRAVFHERGTPGLVPPTVFTGKSAHITDQNRYGHHAFPYMKALYWQKNAESLIIIQSVQVDVAICVLLQVQLSPIVLLQDLKWQIIPIVLLQRVKVDVLVPALSTSYESPLVTTPTFWPPSLQRGGLRFGGSGTFREMPGAFCTLIVLLQGFRS